MKVNSGRLAMLGMSVNSEPVHSQQVSWTKIYLVIRAYSFQTQQGVYLFVVSLILWLQGGLRGFPSHESMARIVNIFYKTAP